MKIKEKITKADELCLDVLIYVNKKKTGKHKLNFRI